MREVKIRAVRENRKLKDAIAEPLRRGLARRRSGPRVRRRVTLPIVECAREARPGEEAAPERVASLLLEEESTDAAFRQFRGLDLELLGGSD